MSTLEKIAEDIRKCKKCRLWKGRKNAVPGEGPSNAKIFFIGEAPGHMEDELGRPFVGPSGQFLTNLIQSIGLKRENVFITSPIKCRPPGNRRPRKDEIEKCLPYLEAQINAVQPRLLVLLGLVAVETLLGDKNALKKYHGQKIERNGYTYFVTFHPAAGRRFPSVRKLMRDDFMKLKKLIQQLRLER